MEKIALYSNYNRIADAEFAEGKAERWLFAAGQMKKPGEPIEKIMAFTGLTREQIEMI